MAPSQTTIQTEIGLKGAVPDARDAGWAVAAVANLVDAPELLCLAMALRVGLCLYLSLPDSQPRSHALILAGYTVALMLRAARVQFKRM